MSRDARQLAFDLAFRPALGREDFLVGACNAEAVAWIDRWPDWPGRALALCGPPGCGKSHLAAVWQAASGARSAHEALRDPEAAARGPVGPLLLDDADRVPDERALLHLYNSMAAAGGTLMLAAREPPARWPIGLADLASRLRAAPVAAIRDPDEATLAAVLVKLFADRQTDVDPAVVAYLAPRMERSFAAARGLAARLDRAALAARRRVTVPLARAVLAEGDG